MPVRSTPEVFRLNVIELHVPPIADRPDDILPLADYFLATRRGQEGAAIPSLGDPAREALLQHEWPGNARELQNGSTARCWCAGAA